MINVTPSIDEYREAMRHLWNMHFRSRIGEDIAIDERTDHWDAICALLFESLVLFDLGKGPSHQGHRSSAKPYPFLHVVPRCQGSVPSLYVEDTSRTQSDEVQLSGEVDMHFVECSNWGDFGFLDFDYYSVEIARCPERPDLVGRRAMVPTRSTEVFFSEE